MEIMSVFGVVAILFVGWWHVCKASHETWKQQEAHPDSVREFERKWNGAPWGPFLLTAIVIAWSSPELNEIALAAFLINWAVDGIWFKYADWRVARANPKNRKRNSAKSPTRPAQIASPDAVGNRPRI